MIVLFIFELAVVCLLAMLLGFILDRLASTPPPQGSAGNALGGPMIMGVATLISGAFMLSLVNYFYLHGRLLFDQLPAPYLSLGTGYLANTVVTVEVALIGYLLAAALGYFLDKTIGTLVFTGYALAAGSICVFFSSLPAFWYAIPEWLAPLLGIAFVGTLGTALFAQAMGGKQRGQQTLMALWLGFCLVNWIGYQIAGQLGLLFISLPAVVVFWIGVYVLSRHILPIEKGQELLALRSLITYNLGTNYPYYLIQDWKNQTNKEQRVPPPQVPGNVFLQFFAGPGIILTSSDHLAVVSDGIKLEVKPPGLSFTKLFQHLYAAVDLRPQLRTTTIQVETKDGIQASIFTFLPHRIGTGGKTVALGESYPYDEASVLKAVYDHAVVDHNWKRDEQGQAIEKITRTPWDEVILTVGPPLMKEVISGYECSQLHAPGDPRVEIMKTFKAKLQEAVEPLGIELAGGGISNIVVPDNVIEQRIKNWDAKWEREKEFAKGEAEAEAARQIERVWRDIELELLYKLTKILETAGEVSDQVLAYKLIEAIAARVVPAETNEQAAVDYFVQLARRRSI